MLDSDFKIQPGNEFRIRPGSFSELRAKIMAPMLISFVLITAGVAWVLSGSGSEIWFIGPVFIAFIGFSIYRSIRKQETAFYSYRLTINPEGITRERDGMPTIFIPRNEITHIRKNEKGIFSITAKGTLNVILVFAQIERPAELEQQLSAIAPIEHYTTPWWQKAGMLLVFVMIASVYGVFGTDNIWISGLALLVFVAIMTWSLVATYMSRNVEHKLKRLAWIGLIPLLTVIFGWLSRWELWW